MKRFLIALPVLAIFALAGCARIEGSPTTVAQPPQTLSAAPSSESAPRPYPSLSEAPTDPSEPSTTEYADNSACGILDQETATKILTTPAVLDHSSDDEDGTGCTYTDQSQEALLAFALTTDGGIGGEVLYVLAQKYEDKGCDVNSGDSTLENPLGYGAFNMICVKDGKNINTLWFILGHNIAQISFTDDVPPENVAAFASYLIENYS